MRSPIPRATLMVTLRATLMATTLAALQGCSLVTWMFGESRSEPAAAPAPVVAASPMAAPATPAPAREAAPDAGATSSTPPGGAGSAGSVTSTGSAANPLPPAAPAAAAPSAIPAAAPPRPSPTSTAAPTASGRYAVQVGAFRNAASAQTVSEQLALELGRAADLAGLLATLRVVAHAGLHRVWIGGADSLAEAAAQAARVRAATGREVFVTRP